MNKSYGLVIIAALAFNIIPESTAVALPRFAAKVEQKCNLCHINPTGSGMRNTYGAQYFAMTELAVHKTPLDEIGKFQPMISDNISIGADMRMLYIYDKNARQSTLFQMEGNLYVNADLGRNTSLTMSKGYNTEFDIFGMSYILPFQGYVKAGKFQPSYGWRFADHTSFVRDRTLWPPTYTDTGLEFGLYPYGISANIGFFNGTSSQFDDNMGKALAARFEFRRHLKFAGFGIGGSYWLNDRPSGRISMYGPLAYLNLLNSQLIYMGELDWLKDDGIAITSFATTHNLAFMVKQGVWLEAQYDFIDPNIDLTSGKISRYSFSLDYFPIGFFEWQPTIRFYSDDFAVDENYIVYNGQFHFFF